MLLYLYGEDEGQIRSFVEQVRVQCVGESSQAFNLNVFDASETPIERILEAAQTLPVLSAWRVITVSNASAYGKPDWERAIPYLNDPSPSTCLIFRGREAPQLKESVQAISSHGAVLEFRPRTEHQAEAWIRQRVHQEGKRIYPEATQALIERVGTRESEMETELQKLLAYAGEAKAIRAEDVQEVAAEARIHRVFDLTDALAERRTWDALKILHRLLEEGTPPLALLGMMVRQIRLLWFAREALDQGIGKSQWAHRLSIPSFLQDRLLKQARIWDETSLWKAFEGLTRLDRTFKSGGLDPEVLMDHWILNLGQIDPGRDRWGPIVRGNRRPRTAPPIGSGH